LAKGIKLVVVDVPLLFETKGEEAMTGTLVVSASEETQRARVLERPNMTQRKFEEIKKLQMSDEEKRERATFVIRTDCAMEETQAQVAKLIKEIVKE
jgi:dephospho-CoA kinase